MDEDNSQALVRHALREQEELGLDWFNKLQRLASKLVSNSGVTVGGGAPSERERQIVFEFGTILKT